MSAEFPAFCHNYFDGKVRNPSAWMWSMPDDIHSGIS